MRRWLEFVVEFVVELETEIGVMGAWLELVVGEGVAGAAGVVVLLDLMM